MNLGCHVCENMFERLVSVVNVASDICTSVIALISCIFSFSFNLSFFFGQLIVKFVISLFSFLVECMCTLQTVLQVLVEDCIVFLADISSAFSFFSTLVSETGESVINAILEGCSIFAQSAQRLQNFALDSPSLVICFLESVLSIILYCLLLVRNSLVLLGLTSWDLLLYIPNSIILVKRSIVRYVLQYMTGIRDSLKFVRQSAHRLLAGTFIFLTDVPKESLYGLLVCLVVLFMLLKHHRRVRPLVIRNVVYIASQSQRTLVTAWTYLEGFTLWLLTNQMSPYINGARPPANEEAVDIPVDANNVMGADQTDDEIDEREDTARGHLDISKRKPPQEQEDRLCVVCQDNERCTIILPCRHVCLCYECCGMIKRTHGRCPICRHAVRRTMRVYIN